MSPTLSPTASPISRPQALEQLGMNIDDISSQVRRATERVNLSASIILGGLATSPPSGDKVRPIASSLSEKISELQSLVIDLHAALDRGN